jgi:hypothetical protein
MIALLAQHDTSRLSEEQFQSCLAEARATWPAMKPIPWL